jgi:protein-S-isoprenylcysteine O-methyltransferase Ste14
MMIQWMAVAIRLLWVVFEFPYLRRNRIKTKQDWDKHSAKLWDVANAFELVGMILGFARIGAMRTAPRFIGLVGLGLLILGIVIRSIAIHTLGKFFTGTVVIKNDHQLIRTGLYRYLRHPAYTGTLLAHLGFGLAFANWFSLLLSTVPFCWWRCIVCASRSGRSSRHLVMSIPATARHRSVSFRVCTD